MCVKSQKTNKQRNVKSFFVLQGVQSINVRGIYMCIKVTMEFQVSRAPRWRTLYNLNVSVKKKNAHKAFSVKQNLHLIPHQKFKIVKSLIITSLHSLIAKLLIDQTLRNKDCHTSWRSYNGRFRPDWTYWFYGEQSTVKIRDNEKKFTKVRKWNRK